MITPLIGSGCDADLWAGDPEPLDASRYNAAMERLALVQPNPDLDIASIASRIRQKTGGGAMVLVTGNADRDLLAVHQLLSTEFRATLLMGVSSTTSQALVGFQRLGATTLTVGPYEDWAGAWMKAMGAVWTDASAS